MHVNKPTLPSEQNDWINTYHKVLLLASIDAAQFILLSGHDYADDIRCTFRRDEYFIIPGKPYTWSRTKHAVDAWVMLQNKVFRHSCETSGNLRRPYRA